ncbi:MAG: hypothetical protein ACOYU3_02035 [Bacillota bacterium]
MDNAEFIKAIEASREIIKSGHCDKCPCSQTKCEWHGKCFECVMIHRVKKKHLPECLQPILKDIIVNLARTVELDVTDNRPTKENFEYLLQNVPPQK